MRIFATIVLAIAAINPARAWGAAGHQIVATVAQVHLHPDVKQQICAILPKEAGCHLAAVAAWADQVRGRYRETGPMHYVNPIDDAPGEHCSFGEHGWVNDKVNVITAITNTTKILMDPHKTTAQKDIALRFLIHFVGDLHQPLHLTGKMRGGNDAIFNFEGRRRSLHSVWDSGIITKNIRELSNYTRPTNSKQLESALVGAIFDPYVRFIVTEGIWKWWRNASTYEWLECPAAGDPYPHNPPSRWSVAVDLVKCIIPAPVVNAVEHLAQMGGLMDPSVEGFDNQATKLARLAQSAEESLDMDLSVDFSDDDLDFPACPYTWAKPLHPINCEYAWPAGWDPRNPVVELDTPEYLGKIADDKVVEMLLAKAGIRLAAILNAIFLKGEQGRGPYFE